MMAKAKVGGTMSRLAARGAATTTVTDVPLLIPLEKIRFDPDQPRKAFHSIDGGVAVDAAEYIKELAKSISVHGLIEPITVREQEDGTYLVVVGECRTRAHLELGRPTIKAMIRNDLTDYAKRLEYQIAENVNRLNLTDGELAVSIRWLRDHGDDGNPMRAVRIAEMFGKTEGWVAKYLAYGDEEIQRVWVKSGIASGPDAAYLLSRLPNPQQMDILRRVSLPESDPEFLAKPVTRPLIDLYRDEAKRAKIAESGRRVQAAMAGNGQSGSELGVQGAGGNQVEPAGAGGNSGAGEAGHEAQGVGAGEAGEAGAGAPLDAIAQAMQDQYAAERRKRAEEAEKEAAQSRAGYTLGDDERARIQAAAMGMASSAAKISKDDLDQAPVACRVSAANVAGLLALLTEDADLLNQARDVCCEVVFPASLAKVLANKLAGTVVDVRQLNSFFQTELGRLG